VLTAFPRAGAGDDQNLPAQRITAFGEVVEEASVVGGPVGEGRVRHRVGGSGEGAGV
jgi:hypothetical protein